MPADREDDLRREIQTHLELDAEERIADGMSAEDARSAAQRSFGNVLRVREDARAVWVAPWLDRTLQDLRCAGRGFRRTPAMPVAIILTTALAVGINLAMAGLIDRALLRPPAHVVDPQRVFNRLIRGFSELYGPDVAGLVYIEAMDIETTRQELADALPPAERAEALAPPDIPTIPPDTPAGLRAEYENLQQNMRTEFAEARGLRPAGGVPVAVVIAAPPGRLKHPGDVRMRLQINRQANWMLGSTNGLLIVSGAVGHNVAKADPSLVVQAVSHVLNHRNSSSAK
jgi:hypothetical protein